MLDPDKDDPSMERENPEIPKSPFSSRNNWVGEVEAGDAGQDSEESPNLDPLGDMLGEDASDQTPEWTQEQGADDPEAGKEGDGEPGLPTEDDQAASPVWDWTSQYSKPPSRRKNDEEDARGFGSVGDSHLPPEDAQMAAMYVPPEKVEKAHNPNLSFVPPTESKPFPWMVFVLIFAIVLCGMIVLLGVMKVETHDALGNPVRRSPLRILLFKFAGVAEEAQDPNLAAWTATKDRILEVYLASFEYERQNRAYPSGIEKLVESGLIAKEVSRDGWGNQFLLIPIAKRVLSPGPDGRPDTSDDVTHDERGLRYPSEFQVYELNEQGF